MIRRGVWLPPVLLAAVQVVVWPGVPLLGGPRPAPASVAASLAITAAVAVALLWRRANPVAVTLAITAVLTAGQFGLPFEAVTVIGVADLIALFSVGARRPPKLALVTGAAVVAAQIPVTIALPTDDLPVGVELALNAVLYLAVLAAGRRHGRWRAGRAAAAERFTRAEDRRARAAETERRRLARELHDLTAHHLTSIVVSASAAERLAGRRPDLAAAALDHTARTGRSTLEALRRLVEIMRTPPAPDLPGLVASFREAGQPVTLTAPDTPLPDAIPAIVREALTNTLRYAPGAPTHVSVGLTPAGLELTVDNGAPATAPDDPRPGGGNGGGGLGGGNGIAGMRERARAAGGDLTAGPRPGGGWQVHATLPAPESSTHQPEGAERPVGSTPPDRARPQGADGAARPQGAKRPGGSTPPEGPRPKRAARLSGSAHLIDAAWIVAVLTAPAFALGDLLTNHGPRGSGQPALMAALIAIHVLPLAVRRSRPWATVAAVAVTTWTWPVAVATGLLPADVGWIAFTALGADLLAAHAVGRYGSHRRADWLALPAGLLPAGPALAIVFAAGPSPVPGNQPSWPVTVAILTVAWTFALALPFLGAWLAGWLVRRRRDALTTHEDQRVAWSVFHADRAAAAERGRIARGLGDAVLRHTGQMIEAAEQAGRSEPERLRDVLAEARAALAAMRDLLRDLRAAEAPPVAPQPTLAAVPGLVERWRQHGREVTLRVDGAGREVPDDVALSAYRMVELVLTAGTGPTGIDLDVAGDPIRITVRPAPDDPDGAIAAGLRARSGRITIIPGGLTVELSVGVPSSPSV